MGIRIDNAAPAPFIRILDVYEGLPPLAVIDWELRDVITAEMSGVSIGDWPNANLHMELSPESPTRTGRVQIRPRPGEVYIFPRATYRVRVYLNPDALPGVTSGFTPNPNAAVLSLISGGWHEFLPVLEPESITRVRVQNPNQSIAALRCITVPAGSWASNTVEQQGGTVYEYIDADVLGSLHTLAAGPVIIDSYNTIAAAEARAAGEMINPGSMIVAARNTTGANRDINVDLVVVR